jgi:hypothetical protein
MAIPGSAQADAQNANQKANLLGIGQELTAGGVSGAEAQALTAAAASNPLIEALINEQAPSIEQYGQSYNAAEAGLAPLKQNQDIQNQNLYGSTWLQEAQNKNQLTGNQLQQQNIAQQLGIAGAQFGLQEQAAGIQQGQLDYNKALAISQAQSQGAATGTIGTQGYGQKLGQIGEQYNVSSAQLANQLAGQGLSYQGTQLSSANQQAQLQNTAASLGISGQQLQNQLSQGLFQIGQQTGQTGDQLIAQAAQAQAGENQGLGALISNIFAATGQGPQAANGLTDAQKYLLLNSANQGK